ncbi:MAG TPA: TIGR02391 family protein [Devosia sp.]|nr:TIGR02391 family protein [Devosia sp.]
MPTFPPDEDILDMQPEELAPFVLRFLAEPSNDGRLNRYNFSLLAQGLVANRFMEAWVWLEREGFVAPKPGDSGQWVFLTRRGMEAAKAEDFAAHITATRFPRDLDEVLAGAVRPLFRSGDYDTAVFRAFKEVEVRVRKKGGYGDEDIGRALMNTALGPTGRLKVASGNKDDQAAIRELFAGAISACKNPSSHHEVQFDDPREVIDMIHLANHLLRIVDRLVVAP